MKRVDLRSLYTQNCQGARSDTAIEELVRGAAARDAFAVCCQETWRSGSELFQQHGYTFVGVGPAEQHGRGVNGVAIMLSHIAASAWERAGYEEHRDCGDRAMAVRLVVRDTADRKRTLGIFLVSGYAPTSSHTTAGRDAYYATVTRLIERRRPGDVLIIGADVNASIGCGSFGGEDGGGDSQRGAVGPHGIDHVNAAGRRLRSFMESHALCSLTSFFPKK